VIRIFQLVFYPLSVKCGVGGHVKVDRSLIHVQNKLLLLIGSRNNRSSNLQPAQSFFQHFLWVLYRLGCPSPDDYVVSDAQLVDLAVLFGNGLLAKFGVKLTGMHLDGLVVDREVHRSSTDSPSVEILLQVADC